ncbi:MAG: discoidin domain-containing protein, partial [Oscillospiraceae bacterium]|nr:discoidin domain-containing protein [Oscillospiraceae bacterium]
MRGRRKWLAVVLAVALVLPLCPVPATLAAENNNLARGKSVTASGFANSGWVAANLTDGDYTKGWSSASWGANQTGNAWVEIDLGADVILNTVAIRARSVDGAIVCYPVTFTIETRTASGQSVTVVSQTDAPPPTVAEPTAVYTFDYVTARYVRLTATKVNAKADAFYVQLMELEINGSDLTSLVAQAQTFTADMFKPSSWQTLQNAIAAAEAALGTPGVTLSELNAAYAALEAAMRADLVLDKTSVNMKVGDTQKITSAPDQGVIWSSNAPNIASVDQTGHITGLKPGSVIVTAVLDGITRACSVTVKSATTEIVAGGYEIDMQQLPKVYFAQHPEWKEIYDAVWQMHKSNIAKAQLAMNPEDVYFVDEAFSPTIYGWDTMFMMMFDKWGVNQFPTLQSLDNFYYYSGSDNTGKSIGEISGGFSASATYTNLFYDSEAPWSGSGVFGNANASVAKTQTQLRSPDFVTALNAASGTGTWAPDTGGVNQGFPLFAASPVSVTAPSSFAGSGTETDPYQITSAADLETLAVRVNSGAEDTVGKFYLLIDDITLTGQKNHTPIGMDAAGRRFSGTFDGGYHTISGIHIYTSEATQGLFGYVDGGTVKNVGVIGAVIESGIKSGAVSEPGGNCGAIAGQAKNGAKIINCFSRDAYVHVKNAAAGGIVGLLETNSIVENCYSVGFMCGADAYAGGIVALEQGGNCTVKNCYASGEVTHNGNGYIPRKRTESNGNSEYYYTSVLGLNPPLWAWAEWEQYQIHGDIARFNKVINGKTIYQRLSEHFAFIEREKKVENGLYGKTSGDANGLDDSPNQDYPWVTGTGGKGEQTYNDLSIQQAQQAYYLALIAKDLGKSKDYEYFADQHRRISALINELMWDEDAGMYSNLDTDGYTHTNISTPTNLWALIGRVATPERAQRIVEAHALNSEKLFRPNGLATLAYDYPGDSSGRSAFSAKGKYWNGSMWAPTAYQYIKGLSAANYGDIAFNEAIRHVNTLYDTYKKGREGAFASTVWECYSPEYLRPATSKNDSGMARPNFVGWTGCLGIGIVLEDLLGLRVSAPLNTVYWTPRLTEANGVEDIWYSTDGASNTVDILAEARLNASDDVTFTVRCDRAFTLTVTNAGVETTFDVPAGEQTLTANGPKSLPNTPTLDMTVSLFNMSDITITKAGADAGTLDYVSFTADKNAAIADGTQNQAHKTGCDQIYNVNTVGTRTYTLRESVQMAALGFTDAYELVRKPLNSIQYSDEGFMVMAEADNTYKMLKIVVGVKNTTAQMTARLSDGSAVRASQTLTADAAEKIYVVTVPFRAASEGQYVYVEYRIPYDAASNADISLKGIFLVSIDGLPSILTNADVTASDASIVVKADDAPGETNDGYAIYVSKNGEMPVRYEHPSLPFDVPGIENLNKYTVQMAGVKGGVEGLLSSAVTVIPEPAGMTDTDRAAVDLAATLPQIFGENIWGEGVIEIRTNLNPAVLGILYGSRFTLSSSTDGGKYGLSNDGAVTRPLSHSALYTDVVVTANLNGAAASRTLSVVLPPVDLAVEPYAMGGDYVPTSGGIDLTALGDKDWLQLSTRDYTDYAKKASGVSAITNFTHLDPSYRELA